MQQNETAALDGFGGLDRVEQPQLIRLQASHKAGEAVMPIEPFGQARQLAQRLDPCGPPGASRPVEPHRRIERIHVGAQNVDLSTIERRRNHL